MAKKVGIREISERAGVSLSTVSHALNGTAPISDAVRQKVLGIAAEMGYLAKRQARAAIATLSAIMVAVPENALPDSDVNLVSWTILSALTRDCEARGVKLVPFPMSRGIAPGELVAALRRAEVDGLILLNDDRPALLAAVAGSGVPAVLINGEDPSMLLDSVTPGNRFAAQKATHWLIEQGHRDILHLTWPARQTVRRRRDGYCDALTEAGFGAERVHVVMAEGFDPKCGEAAVRAWLAQNGGGLGPVTAIFCAADNLAFGAMRALGAAGFRVPGDISVMGFDGVALGGLHAPPLTTVSIPLEEFGAEALNLLQQRVLAGRVPRASRRVELGCEIVERASVARLDGA